MKRRRRVARPGRHQQGAQRHGLLDLPAGFKRTDSGGPATPLRRRFSARGPVPISTRTWSTDGMRSRRYRMERCPHGNSPRLRQRRPAAVADPSNEYQVVNLRTLQAASQGISPRDPCQYATPPLNALDPAMSSGPLMASFRLMV
jgi:hypothetical protein